METSMMLCSCSQSKPTFSFAPISSHCDARFSYPSSLNPDVGSLFILGRSRIARSGRSRTCVSSRLPDMKLTDGRGATCLRQSYENNKFGRRLERRSSRGRGRIAAVSENTMWITASSAVALVFALALFAAFGGFLLSMAVENEAREEEEKPVFGVPDQVKTRQTLVRAIQEIELELSMIRQNQNKEPPSS